jgi:hypothetical protein
MAQNPRIDDQKDPVKEALITWEVGPVDFKSVSHAQDAIGSRIEGIMNSTGYLSTKTHDSDGNHNEVMHGHHKTSSLSKTGDLAGHEDHRRIGGSRESTKQGSHNETDESKTHAVGGPKIDAAQSGVHNHGVGGKGKHHMQGDQNLSVEDGCLAFASTKGSSFHSQDTLHLGSDKQISLYANSNWAMTSQANSSMFTVGPATITSTTSISLQVGQSQIIIDQNSITLKVGNKGIVIDSGGVSITGTTYVGQSSLGGKAELNNEHDVQSSIFG